MGHGLYGQRVLQDWIEDKKRPEIKTQEDLFRNRKYIFDLKRASNELTSAVIINYFLLSRLKITECRVMMNSAKKQRNFCRAIINDLEVFAITPEWEYVFDRDINRILTRVKHISFIAEENLSLTPYYPYFEQVGFDRMLEIGKGGSFYENDNLLLDVLIPEMEAWNAEHAKEVANHMKQVEPSITKREAFLAKKKASEQAEKETAKLIKKAEQEEINLIKENARKDAIRQRKLKRELDKYMTN